MGRHFRVYEGAHRRRPASRRHLLDPVRPGLCRNLAVHPPDRARPDTVVRLERGTRFPVPWHYRRFLLFPDREYGPGPYAGQQCVLPGLLRPAIHGPLHAALPAVRQRPVRRRPGKSQAGLAAHRRYGPRALRHGARRLRGLPPPRVAPRRPPGHRRCPLLGPVQPVHG